MVVGVSVAGLGTLMAQNLGRAGPIPEPHPAGHPWAALLLGALLWALASFVVAAESARGGCGGGRGGGWLPSWPRRWWRRTPSGGWCERAHNTRRRGQPSLGLPRYRDGAARLFVSPSDERRYDTPRVRFTATVGEEPEVEVGLV
jgi:hypothetical protein